MSDVNELITALAAGDMVKANDSFNSVMNSKINDAIDDTKIQMAQSMMVDTDESESESEDETNNDEL